MVGMGREVVDGSTGRAKFTVMSSRPVTSLISDTVQRVRPAPASVLATLRIAGDETATSGA